MPTYTHTHTYTVSKTHIHTFGAEFHERSGNGAVPTELEHDKNGTEEPQMVTVRRARERERVSDRERNGIPKWQMKDFQIRTDARTWDVAQKCAPTRCILLESARSYSFSFTLCCSLGILYLYIAQLFVLCQTIVGEKVCKRMNV